MSVFWLRLLTLFTPMRSTELPSVKSICDTIWPFIHTRTKPWAQQSKHIIFIPIPCSRIDASLNHKDSTKFFVSFKLPIRHYFGEDAATDVTAHSFSRWSRIIELWTPLWKPAPHSTDITDSILPDYFLLSIHRKISKYRGLFLQAHSTEKQENQ